MSEPSCEDGSWAAAAGRSGISSSRSGRPTRLLAVRRNGLTVQEIGEVILQSAIYCGVPAANHAFVVATSVLDQEVGR